MLPKGNLMPKRRNNQIIPPEISLFAAALVRMTGLRYKFSYKFSLIADILFGALIRALLPMPSIAPFWGALTSFLSRWPVLVGNNFKTIAGGGPLGPGCSKLVEVLSAILLWRVVNGQWPDIRLGPLPSWKAWTGILVLSGGVNLVLYVWSQLSHSRGNHVAVNDMIDASIGRSLSVSEHVQIFLLAMINGACEEATSRHFWMKEFENYLESPLNSNLAQAAIFGAWHYHGIPSGWVGVGLTFVYGVIMGFLYQYGQGMLMPVIAHGIADYYIFASIVRQQDIAKSE